MPIVGHIMETGQVIYTEMRDGNVPPSKENLEVMQGAFKSAVKIEILHFPFKSIVYRPASGRP